jgi:hypothetical protein
MNNKQRQIEVVAIRWVLANRENIMALLRELQRVLDENETP